MSSGDPLVVVPDARFGGGGQAMVTAFVDAVRALGREPETVSPGFVPVVDAGHQVYASRRIAKAVRRARSVWVVAAAAHVGAGAAATGRPYVCWVATSLADEWPARVPFLSPSRRLSHRLNGPLLRRLERETLARAAAVFGISPASRDALARASGRTDVGIIPIPVDVERFAPVPDDEWRAGLERPTVVFVGRGDDPRKNARLLLDAWPLVRDRVPSARLTLVGRPPVGPLPAGVESRGEVADVAVELRRGTLFVLPSLQEGFGIVAAEALACGVPVVSTPCGGPEQLVGDSGGGVVLEGFDPASLAGAVTRLLLAPDELATLRSQGRAYVEREHAPSVFRARLAAMPEPRG